MFYLLFVRRNGTTNTVLYKDSGEAKQAFENAQHSSDIYSFLQWGVMGTSVTDCKVL